MNKTVAPLRLERFIPMKDVRKLIWRYLDACDREMVKHAQNSMYSVESLPLLILDQIKNGNLPLVQWMYPMITAHNVHSYDYLSTMSIQKGFTEVYHWFITQGVFIPRRTHFLMFVVSGYLDMMIGMLEKNPEWMSNDVNGHAARRGHVNILEWIRLNHPIFLDVNDIRASSMDSGKTNVLEWMLLNGYNIPSESYISASNQGHIHVLEWALSHGQTLPENITDTILNQRAVLWFYEHGYTIDWNRTASIVIGNLKTFQIAIQNGFHLTPDTCQTIATLGGTELLKWIYTHVDSIMLTNNIRDIVMCALEGLSFECYRWLRMTFQVGPSDNERASFLLEEYEIGEDFSSGDDDDDDDEIGPSPLYDFVIFMLLENDGTIQESTRVQFIRFLNIGMKAHVINTPYALEHISGVLPTEEK